MARPFKDARYPGVSSRIKNGKLIFRYRAKGMPEIRLPGKPGDPDFETAYQEATQGQGKKAVIIDLPGRALPKTFGHAARRLETVRGVRGARCCRAVRRERTRACHCRAAPSAP
jgi:hypothetical protein